MQITLVKKNGRLSIVACLAVLIGVIILVVGIIYYSKRKSCDGATSIGTSKEGKHFTEFLDRVKQSYYEAHSHAIVYDPDVNVMEIIDNFNPYDASPNAIKKRTDSAAALKQELVDMKLDKSKLKPRERKAMAQVIHFLDSNFGNPYEEDYYAGDWMMGPNYFCWNLICSVGRMIKSHFSLDGGFVPKSASDVTKILLVLEKHETSINQYIENMKYGVKAGMVRAQEDCTAGLDVFKTTFRNISASGAAGVLGEDFAATLTSEKYYASIPAKEKELWLSKEGKPMPESVKEFMVKHVGRALESLIVYMEKNHSRHCVPTSVSSGLANLPLPYIWVDGKEDKSQATSQILPTGEKLNGKKAYERILPYFTTSTEYTADKIFELGIKQRDALYVKALSIAKEITGILNSSQAVLQLKADLHSPRMYFNTSYIPELESGANGAGKCYSMETAKANCPVRYEALRKWFDFVQIILGKIEPKTVGMFYMTGKKVTTPNCPVKMVANFNPSSGSQSYREAGKACARAASYMVPFFLTPPGPMYSAYSVAGHEGRPGHHTQVQGFSEHFEASGSNDVIDWLNANNYYTAFTEGWALYAENPLLARETDLYKDNLLQEYGMLKWQIWRALRLIIDTGLHYRGTTLQDALDMFEQFAWDATDKSYKDSIRYMSGPGQATAYMIGQLAIWNMRNKTEQRLQAAGVSFDEKEFHYQILSQGSSPLQYLQEHIDLYMECKIDVSVNPSCPEILDPTLAVKGVQVGSAERWKWIAEHKDVHDHYD